MRETFPASILEQHIAILGKTGSGKTSTEKLAVEQVVAGGLRVCILDSVKSDWWGITSSADGREAGLPFCILGGPRGHVPLPSSAGAAIGQLVGSGKLPLSIIDMADFEPGGLQKFFVDFAQALMRHARGVLYLVIEEAHEFAPKERSGIGAENMTIHWAKKLATAGRSKGIRLIVATQRVQSLHNAVLGSCDTVIAHRLTTPADQKPVIDWMKANCDRETQERVAASLSSLPTGTGWVCSGEARIFEKVAFPKFSTFDNTATPLRDGGALDVKTAPVDQDELRAIIGQSVAEAEANDPKALRADIARLKAIAPAKSGDDEALRAEVHRLGQEIVAVRGTAFDEGVAAGRKQVIGLIRDSAFDLMSTLDRLESGDPAATLAALPTHPKTAPMLTAAGDAAPHKFDPDRARAEMPPIRRKPPARGDGLSAPQLHLLKAMAWWEAMGHKEPTRAQVAAIAGWKLTSTHVGNVASSLATAGLLHYPAKGLFSFTAAGRRAAPSAVVGLTLRDRLRGTLNRPQQQVFDVLVKARGSMSREEIAVACGWSLTSTHVGNVISSLSTLEIVCYPQRGQVALAAWARA